MEPVTAVGVGGERRIAAGALLGEESEGSGGHPQSHESIFP